MQTFEVVLVILLGAVVVLALARRFDAPYPAFLALAGAALALLPIGLSLRIDPGLALALFVAPVLLDAAYDTPTRDLKRNWLPVTGLVVVAVGLTTAAVAAMARMLVPDLPWAAAIALGAIVAPPDAAAATAVLAQARLPHRITVVLTGESLLNDASALLVYRLAVAATAAGTAFGVQAIAPAFLLSVVVSVIAGPLVAVPWLRLTRKVRDAPSAIILQFTATFGIWILAEKLHLSPILTVVAYGITVARYAPASTPARLRVPSYAVWETAVVVLNALAFVLIGLQLGGIITHAPAGALPRWAAFGGAVLATVIVIRLAWVMTYGAIIRWRDARRGVRRGIGEGPTWQGGLIVSWCGMRGIVTVAAALALPDGFPERDLLLFTAFAVTLGTLVLQGLTLGPLVRALDLHDDQPVEREMRAARIAMAEAALEAVGDDRAAHADLLRSEIELERATAAEANEGDGRAVLPSRELKRETLVRRRARLLDLRRDGTIGDDAFHRLEEELDFSDLAVGQQD